MSCTSRGSQWVFMDIVLHHQCQSTRRPLPPSCPNPVRTSSSQRGQLGRRGCEHLEALLIWVSITVFILVWESGNGHLGAPVSPLGMSHQTPVSSHPRSLHMRGSWSVLSRKSLGPLLWGQDLVYFPQCLLPAAEKQERVITFEFLPFAFNSLSPPQRSSLKTDSVYNTVGVFVYNCRSLEEDSRVRCLLLGVFIILTLTMAEKRDIGFVRSRETGSHTVAWNSLCRPGWFHIYSNLPASACWILGLQV